MIGDTTANGNLEQELTVEVSLAQGGTIIDSRREMEHQNPLSTFFSDKQILSLQDKKSEETRRQLSKNLNQLQTEQEMGIDNGNRFLFTEGEGLMGGLNLGTTVGSGILGLGDTNSSIAATAKLLKLNEDISDMHEQDDDQECLLENRHRQYTRAKPNHVIDSVPSDKLRVGTGLNQTQTSLALSSAREHHTAQQPIFTNQSKQQLKELYDAKFSIYRLLKQEMVEYEQTKNTAFAEIDE